jgi:hypothetical protein
MFPLVVAEALTTTPWNSKTENEDTVAVTAKAISGKPYPVVAIIAGGDRGVDFGCTIRVLWPSF